MSGLPLTKVPRDMKIVRIQGWQDPEFGTYKGHLFQ